MVAFIRVVDTPYAAKTGADGVVVIHDLPPGEASLHVWRPYLKAPNNEVARPVILPHGGGAAEVVTVDLHPPPAMKPMY